MFCATWLVIVVMVTEEFEEGPSASKLDDVLISGGCPCNPLSGEAWLLPSLPTVLGGDFDDSIETVKVGASLLSLLKTRHTHKNKVNPTMLVKIIKRGLARQIK